MTTAQEIRRETHREPSPSVSTLGVVRSEWIKLTSVRSVVWSFVIAAALAIGASALMTTAVLGTSDGQLPELQLAMFATIGVPFVQLVFAIVGVIAITGEYASGQIRSSLTAVPRRTPVLLAKAAVAGVIAFAVGIVSLALSGAVSSLIATAMGEDVPSLDGLVPSVLFASLYLALVTVFSLAVGALVRSGAGAIAVVLSLLLVLPSVLSLIPVDVVQELIPYQLSQAGASIVQTSTVMDADFWRDLVTVVAWPVVALGGATLALVRRDA